MSDLLNKASLVMVPSGYKEDTVYSVVPSDGSGDLSFTRASNGTRVNSAGFVEVVAWNLLRYSEDFTNAVYSKFNSITATADQATAPNGTTTADKIGLSTASTTFPNLAQDAQYIGGQVYTFVVYLKKNTVNFGKIRVGGTAFASSTNSPIFNLNTGVLVSGTGTIENVGNGWYRCSMTATADTSAAGGFAIDLPDSAGVWNGSSVYNVNDSIFAWGFMSNIGSTAKPYFPTTDRLNVPRLTYQNGGGGCPSLLLEKQSTNLFSYSEEFDNAYWTKASGSISANATTSPDGTQNADKLVDGASNGQILRAITTSAIPYTFSVFAKKAERGSLTFSTSYGAATFDLTTGVASSVSGVTALPTDFLTNDWVRVSVSFTATAATPNFRIVCAGSGTIVDGTSGIYIYGAQLEASSYPTSYIPTTSSSATRVADVAQKTGISSLIGQTEGTIFLDAYFDDLDTVNFSISDGTSGNYVLIDSSSGAVVFARVQQGGATQATINTSASFYTVGARLKCAIAYKANDFAFYINGTLIGTDNSGSVPACDQIRFARWNGVVPATQRVNEVITFKTRLTNAELAQLTA